jgi:Tol biopolymer transport system component
MIRRVITVAFVWFACHACGAQTFTLQQVMSAPFSSGLQAAPRGDDLLWVANQEGRRNIWVAEKSGTAYGVRQVTSDNADDGVDVGDITWTPDGTSIVYARGGDFEFPEKPSPMHASWPTGVRRRCRRTARRWRF